GEYLTAEADVVLQIHIEQGSGEQRALREVPLDAHVVVRGPDGLEIRITASATADARNLPRRGEVGRAREGRVVGARHGLGDRKARHNVRRHVDLEVGTRQEVAVSVA